MADGDLAGQAQRRLLKRWQMVWDQEYHSTPEVAPHYAGWRSSYTQAAIPASEMRDWLEQAVNRLRGLRHDVVLDIGCGSGLVIDGIGRDTKIYHARDISSAAIDGASAWCAATAGLGHVRFCCCEASDFTGIEDHSIDLIVLNSVIQYFPNRAYLSDVIGKALRALAPRGTIFIGDVRNARLSEAFFTSVQHARLACSNTVADLRAAVARAAAGEPELLISPEDLCSTVAELDGAASVQLLIKLGRHSNEMSKFRYDVMIGSRRTGWPSPPRTLRWGRDIQGTPELLRELDDVDQEGLLIERIPDARLTADLGAVEAARTLDAATPLSVLDSMVAHIPPAGIDPNLFMEQAHQSRIVVRCSPSVAGAFDLLCVPRAGNDG